MTYSERELEFTFAKNRGTCLETCNTLYSVAARAFSRGGASCLLAENADFQSIFAHSTSAVDWDVSWKFGVQDFDIPKRVTSWKPKPEVDFQLYNRHIEKSILHHNSALLWPIWIKFDNGDAKCPGDNDEKVDIETGNKIPI